MRHSTELVLAVALVSASCGRPAPPAGSPATNPAVPDTEAEAVAAASAPAATGEPRTASDSGDLLPAGLYWVGYDTCEECPRPTVATLVVVDDEAAAREAVAGAPAGLPLGYPLVVHTDELGLADRSIRGIAVVLGLHETPAQGAAWLAAVSAHAPAARALRIGEPRYWESGEGLAISRVAAGERVPAYEREAVERLENQQREEVAPEVLAEQLQPLCAVAAGDLFLVRQDDLAWYRWAPVRCGTQAAYIPWRASLLGWATVIPSDSGHRLRQVTHVECDRPDIEEWAYDGQTGRAPKTEAAPAALGGC